MRLDRIIDRVGDSYPQLSRELQQRLTPNRIGIAIVCSLLWQGYAWLEHHNHLPVRIPGSDLFQDLSWIIFPGIFLSVYMLAADFVYEQKQGTSTFLQLSPQSIGYICWGKILGVPILIYIVVMTIVPLQLWAGINSGSSLLDLAGLSAEILSLWFLCLSAAILSVLLGGMPPILTATIFIFPVYLRLYLIANRLSYKAPDPNDNMNCRWFGIPIDTSPALEYLFWASCNLAIAIFIWQAIERLFINPNTTPIGKSQSYVANLCFQIWLVGFEYRYLSSLPLFSIPLLLLFIPWLLPSRSDLQNWLLYDRKRATHRRQKFWRWDRIQDLICHDKSPILLAMVINIGIALLPIPIVFVFDFSDSFAEPSKYCYLRACLNSIQIILWTTIAQVSIFANFKHGKIWRTAIFISMLAYPFICSYLTRDIIVNLETYSDLLLFLPLPYIWRISEVYRNILPALMIQLIISIILSHQFNRKSIELSKSLT